MKNSWILIVVMVFGAEIGFAKAWKRTDTNAKVIATKVNELEESIEKIAKSEGDDDVSKRDELKEKIIIAEIELVDALQTIIYHGYKSKNQKRYMKRVAKNVTATQLEALQHILDTLEKHQSWMTDAYAMDYIEKESEKFARKEILALKGKFQKHSSKDIAALVRRNVFN